MLVASMRQAGMTGGVMHAIQQGTDQQANLLGRKAAIIHRRVADQMGISPFPIRGENGSQTRHVRAIKTKAGRVGIGQRLGNILSDMLGIPRVREPDVEQICTQRQFCDRAGLMKRRADMPPEKAGIDPGKGNLGALKTVSAQVPAFAAAAQGHWRVCISPLQCSQRFIPGSSNDRTPRSCNRETSQDLTPGGVTYRSLANMSLMLIAFTPFSRLEVGSVSQTD
ncbi:hypothetical protein ACFSUK_16605 [Sphingobium scionense]